MDEIEQGVGGKVLLAITQELSPSGVGLEETTLLVQDRHGFGGKVQDGKKKIRIQERFHRPIRLPRLKGRVF
jgi:hypothetical protein